MTPAELRTFYSGLGASAPAAAGPAQWGHAHEQLLAALESGAVRAAELTPGDPGLFVVNYEPIIYFLAQTGLPTRYAFPVTLIGPHQGLLDVDARAEVERILGARPRFIVINEHDPDNLSCDRHYLGIERSSDLVIVQIALRRGRSVEAKQALYGAIAERLSRSPGVRPADVFVTLVENGPEDWSFGDGVAQYVK